MADFNPNLGQAWAQSQDMLGRYNASLQPTTPITGLEQLLKGVGAYTPWEWTAPDFQGPGDYQAYDFQLPEVQGVADQYFDLARSRTEEDINRQYAGNTQRLVDQMTIAPTRQSQALALLANQGVQQEAATTRALTDLGMEQAQANVGIAQGQQQMEFSRQQALARELLTAHQSAEENAKFQAGMEQWLQEQQASEREKAYQSRYGLAQDRAQVRMNEWEANRAATLDYQNALLQGQQAGTQGFSQAATYYTNLTEDERKDLSKPPDQPNQPSLSLNPASRSYPQYSNPSGGTYQNQYSPPAKTTSYRSPGVMKAAGGGGYGQ